MESQEYRDRNSCNDAQSIGRSETKEFAYYLGEKGIVFPGKITRGDFVLFLHVGIEAFKTVMDEIKNVTIDNVDDKEKYVFDRIQIQMYQTIFEFQNGKYYTILKNDLTAYTSDNLDESTIKVEQVLRAFENGLFYPCACATIAMIEGTLGEAAQSADTRLYELINSVSTDSNHPDKDLISENLKGFISMLSKSAHFVNEQEPDFLNRHWLLHGRSKKEINKYDCLLLLNAYREILELVHGYSSK